ncbi:MULTISPECIES: SCO2322 family protein [Streptomyces]|uniref:SCO2322 family protein n=1 Tax=Streptomyces TaxID=1883 RepID=UPI0004CDDACB|nr:MULTISPECIES: SCO2322 family protein [Streptomyces]
MKRSVRPLTYSLAIAVTAGTLALTAAAPAHADDYRYWSLRHGDNGTWRTTAEGPGTYRPADGAVEGLRFAVFRADTKESVVPRAPAGFKAICASTPAKTGTKRVALVLDFGTAQDAPSGEKPPSLRSHCVQLPPQATTAEALAKAAPPLRYAPSGLLCAIAGYPQRGCGEAVTDSSGRASGSDSTRSGGGSGGGPSVGLLLGGGIVIALVGATAWQVRRRRNAS